MSSPPPAVDNLQKHACDERLEVGDALATGLYIYLIVHNNFTESIARYWVVLGHTKSLHVQNLNCIVVIMSKAEAS